MGLWSEADLKSGKLNDGREQRIPKKLTEDKESIMPEIVDESESKALEVKSETTQLMASKEHYETMKTGLLHSVNLIDSTTSELHSQMKELSEPKEGEVRATNFHKMDTIQTISGIARGINDLLKTKIVAIKTLQEVVDNEPYEINPEEPNGEESEE